MRLTPGDTYPRHVRLTPGDTYTRHVRLTNGDTYPRDVRLTDDSIDKNDAAHEPNSAYWVSHSVTTNSTTQEPRHKR